MNWLRLTCPVQRWKHPTHQKSMICDDLFKSFFSAWKQIIFFNIYIYRPLEAGHNGAIKLLPLWVLNGPSWRPQAELLEPSPQGPSPAWFSDLPGRKGFPLALMKADFYPVWQKTLAGLWPSRTGFQQPRWNMFVSASHQSPYWCLVVSWTSGDVPQDWEGHLVLKVSAQAPERWWIPKTLEYALRHSSSFIINHKKSQKNKTKTKTEKRRENVTHLRFFHFVQRRQNRTN